ncbi:MAG: DNA repair protein RecO [Anaerolineales bacterium]|nr:MAG: DNA repair protein RecO [Anaerolineales bacterium]
MDKPRSLRVEAVVLRHSDFGEADRLLTLYTREQGKTRAVAKGARKIASRKAGHLEPFTRVKLQLARGRDLFIVTQAETVDAYPALRVDLTLTGYAAYVLELVDRFVPDEESASPSLYRLLTETLSRLDAGENPWLTVRSCEMRLLDLLGFRPRLFECANCGNEIQPEDQFFSAALGGAVCPRCGQGLPRLWPVSVDALKYLRHFQRSDHRAAARARPNAETQKEIEAVMQGYFQYLLERELNTPGFIKQIAR